MNKAQRDAITAAEFQIGDAGDFLGLTEEERQLVELRVATNCAARRRSEEPSLTQQQLADNNQLNHRDIPPLVQ